MGDNDTNQQLTHEQRQAEDTTRIETRFGATDAFERVSATLEKFGLGNGSGPGGFFGKTDFEAARLNAMLDLLDSSNPADLESAGDALQRTTKALNRAAGDLDAFVKGTDWEGDSGTEFRRFGAELARYAGDLGTFANAVGTQMKVASEGLTSVRNSKPPRDGRADPKKAEEFPPSERKDDNPDYVAAVKAEKHRQEAINQMNRLASFYAVSEQTLAGQEPPKAPAKLGVSVPRPSSQRIGSDGAGSGADGAVAAAGRQTASGPAPFSSAEAIATPQGGSTSFTATAPPSAPPSTPTQSTMPPTASIPDTSMKIDSVQAPPAPPVTAPSPTAPTAPGGSGPTQVPPVIAVAPNPMQNKVAQAKGAPGAPRPGGAPTASATGRPGAPGGAPPARYAEAGRPGMMGGGPGSAGGANPAAGRAGTASPMGGGSPAAGRAGAAGGVGGQPPMAGRAGAAGQAGMPGMAGRAGGGPVGGAGAGRANGIVGGTPQRAAGGSAAPRIPRGTVIGGESTAGGRPAAARPSRSGVIGAGPANGSARPAGRGTPSANGIVGTPRSGGTAPRPGASGGFTAGGAGLVGRQSRQQSEEEQERSGSARPEYLTEDEETWAVRRRVVPPVID
ncbi:hypothetical protein [Streptomyces sp. NPDC014894]|uniref:hypothetical protein n=1 Tax=Streptomyces sp. NPDC014894 TaxID=3364931 RepID=UPI0036FD3198